MIIHILAGGPAEYCADFSSYENEKVVWAAVDRGSISFIKKEVLLLLLRLEIMTRLLKKN